MVTWKALTINAFAAIVGVIGANYVGGFFPAWYLQLGAGVVLFAVASFVMKGESDWEGPVRLLLGVAGLTLVLRGLIGPGGIVAITLPAQISSVV
jgi:hypothetical protein